MVPKATKPPINKSGLSLVPKRPIMGIRLLVKAKNIYEKYKKGKICPKITSIIQ